MITGGQAATTAPVTSGLRAEIQLLRALAVGAVVANHLAPGLVPGGYLGVDMFFVISGYLITAHLLRELDTSGRIRLRRFWARRVRRLLPAGLLVLAVSAVATLLVMPATLWPQAMRQIAASALYVQNLALAQDAQDYFASAESPSPVTHYWSLSLEEQFYLVWPLLTLAAYALGRRFGRPRLAILLGCGALVAASLTFSVLHTASDPQSAYFLTPARMWQLGIGGLLAMTPALTRGRHLVAAVGWLALLGSVAAFDESSPVPGSITLIPVLGAAAVIWAGDAYVRGVPGPLRPALAAGLWLGAVSYSLYLWHWPLVALTPFVLGRPSTPAVKLVLLVLMLVVAGLSTRWVEDPVRRAAWLVDGPGRRTFLPALAAMTAVVLVAAVAHLSVDRRIDRIGAELDAAVADAEPCVAAAAMANDCRQPHRLRFRDSTLLRLSNDPTGAPAWGRTCQQGQSDTELTPCEFGVPRSEARLRVALVGDSHARHWAGAVAALAEEHGWNVLQMTRSSCAVTSAPISTERFASYADACHRWVEDVVDRVVEDPGIDVVITSGTRRGYRIPGTARSALLDRMAEGYRDVWHRWTEAGKRVVVLGDVPIMRNGDLPTCVAEAGSVVDPCTTPRRSALRRDPLLEAAHGAGPGIVPVDLSRYFCDEARCHSVIGGALAYGDNNHLLGYFSRSLAPYLLDRMRPALARAEID